MLTETPLYTEGTVSILVALAVIHLVALAVALAVIHLMAPAVALAVIHLVALAVIHLVALACGPCCGPCCDPNSTLIDLSCCTLRSDVHCTTPHWSFGSLERLYSNCS